jgi:hypothetical protein
MLLGENKDEYEDPSKRQHIRHRTIISKITRAHARSFPTRWSSHYPLIIRFSKAWIVSSNARRINFQDQVVAGLLMNNIPQFTTKRSQFKKRSLHLQGWLPKSTTNWYHWSIIRVKFDHPSHLTPRLTLVLRDFQTSLPRFKSPLSPFPEPS